MRFPLLAALLVGLVASCYKPELSGPGGFLCSTTNPSCPAGFDCLSGRCVPSGQRRDAAPEGPRPEGPVGPDMMPPPGELGPQPDLPAALTCKSAAASVTFSPAGYELGERFDFEVRNEPGNSEAVVAFFARPTAADQLLPWLVRRSTGWSAAPLIDSAANPAPGPVDPDNEIAVALPQGCPGEKRALVVFRHAGGVWYVTDQGPKLSANADGHLNAGLGLDLIPAQNWSGTKPPGGSVSCSLFWAAYGADGIGTRRIPIDLGPPMVHWFHTVDNRLAQHVAQSWDETLHYVTFATQDAVSLRMGGGDFVDNNQDGEPDPWPQDPQNHAVTIENIATVPLAERGLETAEGYTVFTGRDASQNVVVRLVEPSGANSVVTTVASGSRPSLAVIPAMQQAVAFVSGGDGKLVARNPGGPWSKPVSIPGVSRVQVRAVDPAGTFEVVYRRAGKAELVAERYTCN